LIILAFAGTGLASVRREFSITTDEDKHYLYGEHIVSGNSDRFNPSVMPVTGLNALPQKIASFLPPGRIHSWLEKYYVARAVTIFFSCLVAYLVFHWARLLYGFIPALSALLLYVLDPNIIAHSQLVTTDLYTVGSILFAFYTLWKFAHDRYVSNGLLCLFALGLSQVAKYSAIVLFPLFLITLMAYDLSSSRSSLQKESVGRFIVRYARYGIYAFFVTVVIINFAFLFNRTFTSFGEYRFRSSFLQNIQARFPALNALPVPTPYPYLEGLDYMSNVEQHGAGEGNIYLLGHTRTGRGFPGYYIVASALKVPISSQIIIILALAVFIVQKHRRANLFRNEVFLLIPVMFYAVYFNFFFKTQVGIRYYLLIFPFLYILAGNLFVQWKDFSKAHKMGVIALLAYLVLSVFSYHPYYLSYFNEIVWDRKDAYKYLSDSNIDWGQGRIELDRYLVDHPDAIYQPGKPRPGHLVVRINDLTGVTSNPEKYAWLRDNFEPVDTIVYNYLIYKISVDEINKFCSTNTICN
jgi:4-amino-4-deoxy-L-arabinose transferase-like glycosyltransferase